MGYYVETMDSEVRIAPENVEAAFEAVKALNKRDELKTGGSYGALPGGGYGQLETWFAWMPADYDETAESLSEVFRMLGFEDADENPDDGFRLGWYNSKTGNEDVFLEAIAPYVVPGSYVTWRGEDGEMWANVFDGQTMRTATARVTFDFPAAWPEPLALEDPDVVEEG